MAVILALDQGTTSSRAIVFDPDGRVLSVAQREFAQIFPHPGWVEHDPREIWNSQRDTAVDALRLAGVDAPNVAAIGITNQRETTVLWERDTGRPIGNAIVWQDRRTAALCDDLKARGLEKRVRERTGLLLDPYFSGTKIAWMLDAVPGLRERAHRGEIAFGTVDSWLIWNFTGGRRHVTDVTNASRTLLFDIHACDWSGELLEILNVPRALLPEVLPCSAEFGSTQASIFGAPVRICGVAGDQQAALLGQAGFEAGIAKNTYGTGSFLMLNTGERAISSSHGLLTTIAYALERGKPVYALEGSVFVTGAAVQWLRDGLQIIERTRDVEALARRANDSGGVFFVPAFTGLGAPYWDPHARGVITGLTRGTTRAHIARAALEAAAYQSAEVIEAMQRESGTPMTELRVDGGGSANDLTMQFQADLLGTPVVRPRVLETTALGAAYAAGLQCGFWSSLESIRAQWQAHARFTPSMDATDRERRMQLWRKAVAAARV